MKKIILVAVFVAIVVILYLLNPLLAILAAVLGVFVLLKLKLRWNMKTISNSKPKWPMEMR